MSNKLRHIGLISDEYPPDTGWGGIGTYTYNLARGLSRNGHRVTVIAGCVDQPDTTTENGITLHRITFAPPQNKIKKIIYRSFQFYTRNRLYYRRKLEFAHAAYGLIRRLHQQKPFDLLETAEYDANGYFLARSHRIPLVVKIHTPILTNYHLNRLVVTPEIRACDRLERWQTLRADHITTPARA